MVQTRKGSQQIIVSPSSKEITTVQKEDQQESKTSTMSYPQVVVHVHINSTQRDRVNTTDNTKTHENKNDQEIKEKQSISSIELGESDTDTEDASDDDEYEESEEDSSLSSFIVRSDKSSISSEQCSITSENEKEDEENEKEEGEISEEHEKDEEEEEEDTVSNNSRKIILLSEPDLKEPKPVFHERLLEHIRQRANDILRKKIESSSSQKKKDKLSRETKNQYKKENPRFKYYDREEQQYYHQLNKNEKQQVCQIENTYIDIEQEHIPLRFKILQSRNSTKTKAIALKKLESIMNMEDENGEYHKRLSWIETFCKLPIGIYRSLPIQMGSSTSPKSSPEQVRQFLEKTQHIFDETVYGHKQAKDQFIRILAQWISNPSANGNVIGIYGKPGVGKTTFVKDGICRALQLPFAFIPLGGISDGSYLEGHSYTYEGSMWGKVVDVLMKCGCMNPVMYFDELDKVSRSHHGQEIINLLIHLTDPGQNDKFTDKYFHEIEFDLSKCLFIFTYNHDDQLNPILKDRMIRIETDEYTISDKIQIAQHYILPRLLESFGMKTSSIQFSDTILRQIIEIVPEEAGVRNMKRGLETIISHINLSYISNDPSRIKKKEEISFPFHVDKEMVDYLLENHREKRPTYVDMMYT